MTTLVQKELRAIESADFREYQSIMIGAVIRIEDEGQPYSLVPLLASAYFSLLQMHFLSRLVRKLSLIEPMLEQNHF